MFIVRTLCETPVHKSVKIEVFMARLPRSCSKMRKAHAWTFMRMIVDQRLASLNLNCVSATRGIRVGIRPQFHKR